MTVSGTPAITLIIYHGGRADSFWFSLAAHGTQAYADAVEITLDCAREAAAMIEAHPNLEMVTEQRLSICVFRRIGWSPDDYKRWSDALLERGDGLVTPSKHEGETVLRFCIVNPRTSRDDINSFSIRSSGYPRIPCAHHRLLPSHYPSSSDPAMLTCQGEPGPLC